jgi:hypothetical protein
MFEIYSVLSKIALKIYYFCQHSKNAKKMAKWPNHFIPSNQFQKGHKATLGSGKMSFKGLTE